MNILSLFSSLFGKKQQAEQQMPAFTVNANIHVNGDAGEKLKSPSPKKIIQKRVRRHHVWLDEAMQEMTNNRSKAMVIHFPQELNARLAQTLVGGRIASRVGDGKYTTKVLKGTNAIHVRILK